MPQRPYLRALQKPANFIFKFLSLEISLVQADCHRKEIFVVRSTRFHGLEQSLEILPEPVSVNITEASVHDVKALDYLYNEPSVYT